MDKQTLEEFKSWIADLEEIEDPSMAPDFVWRGPQGDLVGQIKSSHGDLTEENLLTVRGEIHIDVHMANPSKSTPITLKPSHTGQRALRWASHILPKGLRSDWLEEQQAYLLDLPSTWSRLRWVVSTFAGLPRLVTAMRAGMRKETA